MRAPLPTRSNALGRSAPRLQTFDAARVGVAAKVAEPLYASADYRAWREAVIQRSGGRCEAMTLEGRRCARALPRHRMFADHKVEVKDGGALFDIANGQCLCGSHHSKKTAAARAARR